jgi:DNA repair protein RadC
MLHNHPSGKTLPSTADKLITKKIKEAGTILDI